ncbi:MAG: hypothetical protein HQK66_01605 [Desulfamplus sp.]|nr:hypothetical protein [Desulfamplus sp.]
MVVNPHGRSPATPDHENNVSIPTVKSMEAKSMEDGKKVPLNKALLDKVNDKVNDKMNLDIVLFSVMEYRFGIDTEHIIDMRRWGEGTASSWNPSPSFEESHLSSFDEPHPSSFDEPHLSSFDEPHLYSGDIYGRADRIYFHETIGLSHESVIYESPRIISLQYQGKDLELIIDRPSYIPVNVSSDQMHPLPELIHASMHGLRTGLFWAVMFNAGRITFLVDTRVLFRIC